MLKRTLYYPEHGPWGDVRYQGTCSGYLVRDLVRVFHPRSVADPTEGSGTCRAVCNDLDLRYWGSDLREGYDLTAVPLRELVPRAVDLVFLHPPYFRFVRYSGVVWGAAPDLRDLSQLAVWHTYLDRLHRMIEHALTALSATGHLAILVGDTCYRGRVYSTLAVLYGWYGVDIVAASTVRATSPTRDHGATDLSRGGLVQGERCLVIRPGRRPREPASGLSPLWTVPRERTTPRVAHG